MLDLRTGAFHAREAPDVHACTHRNGPARPCNNGPSWRRAGVRDAGSPGADSL